MDTEKIYSKGTGEFVVDANACTSFRIARSGEVLVSTSSTRFPPEMSHQVFGDEESIYGYKNPKVNITFTAGSLQFTLGTTYDEIVRPTLASDPKPDQIEEKVKNAMPFNPLLGGSASLAQVLEQEKTQPFKPPGEKVHAFQHETGKKFEIYRVTNENRPEWFVDYVGRMQFFALWFIDAASYVDADDPKWAFHIIYEKYTADSREHYGFAGYTSVYEYYAYPAHIRPRIAVSNKNTIICKRVGLKEEIHILTSTISPEAITSHMLLLPPYRKMGLGIQMLQEVYRYYINKRGVIDVTVEDPSENFVRLRDLVDCMNCSQLSVFSKESVMQGFKPEMFKDAQKRLKLSKKQARRVYEILRLKYTDTGDVNQYKQYRLDVKQRLNAPFYKRPSEMLRLQLTLTDEEVKSALGCLSRDQRLEVLRKLYDDCLMSYRGTLDRITEIGEKIVPVTPARVLSEVVQNGH